MRILVTGVSGFAGASLAPELLAAGHTVRALARHPARAHAALAEQAQMRATGRSSTSTAELNATERIEVLRGDVLSGEGLTRALDGIEVAYYLIHSMEGRQAQVTLPAGAPAARWQVQTSPFPDRERLAAENFARAAAAAGVRRIVYLGGLLPAPTERPSRHLASREVVQGILFEHVPSSVALRAAIVIGARSRSFAVMVRLLERMPVLALPAWHRFRTQPIDARDVTAMLAAAAHVDSVAGRSLDIGGPLILTYAEFLERVAALMLLRRPAFSTRLALTPLTARLVASITGEDPEFILPLMESLQSDLLPAEDRAEELLDVSLHSPDAAIERALREWEAIEPLAAR